MTQEKKLTQQINAEYILLKCIDWSEKSKLIIEQKFNQHLSEYKDLTGHDFQLDKIINKLNNNNECD